jgi:hypothetical protein
MARSNTIGPFFDGPGEQRAQLEIAIASDARIRRSAAEIILSEGSNHGLDELAAKIQEGVRDAEQRGDFPGAAMVGAIARTERLTFPQAQRNSPDIMALLHQETGGDGTVDTATHGDHDFLIPTNSGHGSHLLNSVSRAAQKDVLRIWLIAYGIWLKHTNPTR